MKKSEFFKNEIKDNNYEGLSLSCITNFENNKKEENAKKEVFNLLKEIEAKFALVDIKDLINSFEFGDEFEANTKQKFFEVAGEDFESVKIYTFNIVGSIHYKNQIFNINSRFGNNFLQYMIASSEGFLELENIGGISYNLNIAQWLMIYYFKTKLKSAFGLGMYKTYTKFNDNLNKIRGQIDINSYIKKEYFDGKIRCDYQEHSFANEINYIISLALNKIFKNKKYQNIIKDLHTIKNAFNQIEYKKQNIKFLKNSKVKNPFYSIYNEVFHIAYKILNDEFGSTSDKNFSAFLFDVSLLFEHHIRKLLKSKLTLETKNKKDYKIPNGCGYNPIYPDIIVKNDDGTISIYDVKYKNFKGEVNREDRFQLLSYVAMYMNDYKIKECGFIYPSDIQKECIRPQILKLAGQKIPFKVVLYEIANINSCSNNEKFINFKKEQIILDKIFFKNFTNQT